MRPSAGSAVESASIAGGRKGGRATTDAASADSLRHWAEVLAQGTRAPDLPLDHARAARRRAKHGVVDGPAAGPQPAPDDARALLLAALTTLVYRHTGDRALLISAVTGFDGKGADPPASVVSLDVDGEAGFDEHLARTAAALAAADSQPPAQIHRLAEELGDPDEAPTSLLLLWDCAPRTLDSLPAFDLALVGRPADHGVELRLAFDSALFERVTAQRLLLQLATVIAAAGETPSEPLATIRILPEEERRLLVEEWNATALEIPDASLHELFTRQAKRTPKATAAVCGPDSLTYAELDARSSKVANRLVALGVEPGALVGVSVERSLEMLVALLGVLKAGAAYVPVDPTYPAERQEYMLEDAGVQVVLTQARLLDRLASVPTAVALDRDWPSIEPLGAVAPAIPHDPERLAYVIYTSGSTGKPKGVEIPHRALVNFLTTMAERPGLSSEDVLVAVTTLSFDIAGLELYLPLLTGARVVIARQEEVGDPRALARLLAESGATVMQATPTTWRMLVDSGWSPTRPLRAFCGGEGLPPALAASLLELGLELWNLYGPTETTIWSTCDRVTDPGEVLIGKPIGNTSLFVLDDRLELRPVGVPGELYIGGSGLARGYRNRPELTAERFVDNPHLPGERMYRTGDLARYRPDGRVEHLGRLDHQVKVRGFRIELGEIESTLTAHPDVANAVAVACTGPAGDPRLVAYVVPQGEPVRATKLRRHLQEKLPPYMVPSAIVSIDAFPLTPNGKIDRGALPAPDFERSELEHERVAPRTPLEERLVEIWQDVLGISPIGITDDFFELGTTSMVAAQLFARIEHELGSVLPLGAIFQAPTIESLATLLESGSSSARWTSLVPIQPQGDKRPIFCVHGGAGTILHLQALGRLLAADDRPFYGLQARGLYGGAPPLLTVETMAEHYLAELRTVQPAGPYHLGGYCFGAIVAFHMAQMLHEEGEEVGLLAMFNGPSPGWIKRYGWFGNQPSLRTARVASKRPPASTPTKIVRVLRDPKRVRAWVRWSLELARRRVRRAVNERWARFSLRRGKPIPEWMRESYFLQLCGKAERLYEPRLYSGDIVMFSAKELYEDPELGWGALARRIDAYQVPGHHDGNRELMHDPHVAVVHARLLEHLERIESAWSSAVEDGEASRALPTA